MSKNTESWTRHFLPRHHQSAQSHSDHCLYLSKLHAHVFKWRPGECSPPAWTWDHLMGNPRVLHWIRLRIKNCRSGTRCVSRVAIVSVNTLSTDSAILIISATRETLLDIQYFQAR